mgnify:CR=1 FL=1
MNRQEFFKTNYGDRLEVTWDGSVWVTSCGMQCSSASEALKFELYSDLVASGEDVEWDELKLADYGKWEDV